MTRTTYVMRDGKLVEKHLIASEQVNAPFVQGDITPHRSMVTGEMVTTRSRHRNILREHGLIEVGNETRYLKPKPITTPPGLKEAIVREVKKRRGY